MIDVHSPFAIPKSSQTGRPVTKPNITPINLFSPQNYSKSSSELLASSRSQQVKLATSMNQLSTSPLPGDPSCPGTGNSNYTSLSYDSQSFPFDVSPVHDKKLPQQLQSKFNIITNNFKSKIMQESLSGTATTVRSVRFQQSRRISNILENLTAFTETPSKIKLGKQFMMLPDTMTPMKMESFKRKVALLNEDEMYENAFLTNNSSNNGPKNLMETTPQYNKTTNINQVRLLSGMKSNDIRSKLNFDEY